MTLGQMPWEMAAGRRCDAGSAPYVASPEEGAGPREFTWSAGQPREQNEPDELFRPTSRVRTALAFAELKAEIDTFLDTNFPGLSLSDLRALAGLPVSPRGSASRSADRG